MLMRLADVIQKERVDPSYSGIT